MGVGVASDLTQKERELISERTRAALAAAKARGKALGGDRGYRPTGGPDAAAAAKARRQMADRAAHRLSLEVEILQAAGTRSRRALARALNEKGIPPPLGGGVWTHTTVARVLHRVGAADLVANVAPVSNVSEDPVALRSSMQLVFSPDPNPFA